MISIKAEVQCDNCGTTIHVSGEVITNMGNEVSCKIIAPSLWAIAHNGSVTCPWCKNSQIQEAKKYKAFH